MIAPRSDLIQFQAKFIQDNVVAMQDFLLPVVAQDLSRYLTFDIPREWWYTATHDGNKVEYFSGAANNTLAIADRRAAAFSAYTSNRFSYSFSRTLNDHHKSCLCIICGFGRFLCSPAMLEFIRNFNAECTGLGEYFASCYEAGDFLGPHHDRENGKIGFTLNLSTEWRPQFGGILCFLSPDWKAVSRAYSPQFNTLVIFKIPKDEDMPHFVTPVVCGRRIALSGWFK